MFIIESFKQCSRFHAGRIRQPRNGRKRSARLALMLLFACAFAWPSRSEAQAAHTFDAVLSNVDDTARIWRWNGASWGTVCDVDVGAYPRWGICSLFPPAGYTSGFVPYLVRFGNGGGGWSSGSITISRDARDRVAFEHSESGQWRGYGWFYEQLVYLNFASGEVHW